MLVSIAAGVRLLITLACRPECAAAAVKRLQRETHACTCVTCHIRLRLPVALARAHARMIAVAAAVAVRRRGLHPLSLRRSWPDCRRRLTRASRRRDSSRTNLHAHQLRRAASDTRRIASRMLCLVACSTLIRLVDSHTRLHCDADSIRTLRAGMNGNCRGSSVRCDAAASRRTVELYARAEPTTRAGTAAAAAVARPTRGAAGRVSGARPASARCRSRRRGETAAAEAARTASRRER